MLYKLDAKLFEHSDHCLTNVSLSPAVRLSKHGKLSLALGIAALLWCPTTANSELVDKFKRKLSFWKFFLEKYYYIICFGARGILTQ